MKLVVAVSSWHM